MSKSWETSVAVKASMMFALEEELRALR